MTGYLDRLNLRPNERRFVVLVALVVFVLLNAIFVWPHFSDWSDFTDRLRRARNKLALYQTKVDQAPDYQKKIASFENENPTVPPEEQSLQFAQVIQSQAVASGVGITVYGRQTTKTNNPFFVEQLQTINVASRESPLVNFLFNLGSGESLIRVRDLSLRPDPPRQNLNGSLTLVASYQRKQPGKAGPASAAACKTTASASPRAVKPAPPAGPPGGALAQRKAALAARTNLATRLAHPAVTNAPAAASWLDKVKGWFGKSAAPSAPAAPAPAKPPASAAQKK